jgi:hypothetical protein
MSLPGDPGLLVFIAGNSRSGTTMIGEALSLHTDVFMLTELHFFEQLWDPSDRDRRLDEAEAAELTARLITHQRAAGVLQRVDVAPYLAEARERVARLDGRAPWAPAEVFRAFLLDETRVNGKRIPCEQTPRNVFFIDDILALYPEARVVVMVRDPRDVLASQKNKWRARLLGQRTGAPRREMLRLRANYHPITMSVLWNASIRAGDRFAGHERVHTLRFEDVLVEPEQTLRRLCEFLGLAYEEGMLDVPQVKSSYERTDAPRGINPQASGRWRRGGLTEAEIYLCQRLTGDGMRAHGYEPVEARPNPARLAASVGTFPLKAGTALAFNTSRYRNLGQAIRRRLRTGAA